MSAYNRYKFIKRLNRKNLILIKGKNRYISFERDMNILRYINFNMNYEYSNLNYLDKYEIDYIVLDNLDIIVEKRYNCNNYMKYLKLYYLSDIVNEIGNNLLSCYRVDSYKCA